MSDNWRPMKTAPKRPLETSPQSDFVSGKHGPMVLLGFDYAEQVSTGFWQPIKRNAWIKQAGWKKDGCWRFLDDDGPWDMQPTHWMPLPDPPEPQP